MDTYKCSQSPNADAHKNKFPVLNQELRYCPQDRYVLPGIRQCEQPPKKDWAHRSFEARQRSVATREALVRIRRSLRTLQTRQGEGTPGAAPVGNKNWRRSS